MADATSALGGAMSAFGNLNFAGIMGTLMWVIISITITIIGSFAAIWAIKQMRFRHPVVIIKNSGSDKIVIETTVAGQFKRNKMFFGWIDWSGEMEWLVKKGQRKIFDASGDDMHIINGRLGFVVEEKPDDPAVLVPIDKSKVENHQLLMALAPSNYRGISVDLRKKGERELTSPVLQYLPYISLVVVGFLIMFMFILFFNFVTGTLHDLSAKCGAAVVQTAVSTPGTAP